MAVWTKEQIETLPASSFVYAVGDVRELPYRDASGKIDPAHVRTALARLDQNQNIPDEYKTNSKKLLLNALSKVAPDKAPNGDTFFIDKVELDQNGNIPDRVQIMETGDWPNSVKGDFSISLSDLQQMKDNFEKGVGFPTEDASTGLAIDFMHNYDAEAAGWIKGLELEVDPNDNTKGKLFASPVEWSDAGADAIKSGKFKMLSPSGYFGSKNGKQMSMWSNPRNLKEKVANVLDGAGLTNIPFLRGMSPIRASAIDDTDSAYGNVIYVVNNQHKKEQSVMDLDALRVKEATVLSGAEYKFLADNKEQLSADEQDKFSLQVTAAADDNDQISDEDRATLDAIGKGTKKVVDAELEVVDKSTLDNLKSSTEQYQTEKATEVVNKHVSRGAIKQDASEFWTKQLLSVAGEDRKALEDQLAALPDNDILKQELGSAEDVAAGSTPREQLHVIANQKVAAAAKEGKEVLYTDALREAIRENADIAKADLIETKKVGA